MLHCNVSSTWASINELLLIWYGQSGGGDQSRDLGPDLACHVTMEHVTPMFASTTFVGLILPLQTVIAELKRFWGCASAASIALPLAICPAIGSCYRMSQIPPLRPHQQPVAVHDFQCPLSPLPVIMAMDEAIQPQ